MGQQTLKDLAQADPTGLGALSKAEGEQMKAQGYQ